MSSVFQSIVKKVSEVQAGIYENNSAFNEYYDGISDISVEGLRPSEILYKCDPNAYDVALNDWRQENFEEKFSLTLDLLKDELIKNRVRPLIKALKKSKVAPFIGAGLSIPCGKKSWPAMLLDIGQRSNRIDQDKFKEVLDSGDYIEAADIIASGSSEQLDEYIKLSLSDATPCGAVMHLPDIASECIITSNLDCILESVYHEKGKPFDDGYMYGIQENHFFHHLVSGGRCLLKIHGTCLSPATQVFTRDQYDRAYGDEDNVDFSRILPKALRQIFVSNSLLFLGCSLIQDRTLELFEKVIESSQYFIPDHYALLEKPEDGDVRDREHELAKLNIHPIWYPFEKHEHVENFIQFLAIHKNNEAPNL